MHLHPIDKSLIPLAILFAFSHQLGKHIQWETSINQCFFVDPLASQSLTLGPMTFEFTLGQIRFFHN
jgi:hypothetical protein